MQYMCSDKSRFDNLIEYIHRGIKFYFMESIEYYPHEEQETDVNLIKTSICELKKLNDKDLSRKKFLIYSFEVLVCGIIEKILRAIFYEKVNEVIYVSASNSTLGSLLISPEIINVIGKINAEVIEYCLLDIQGVGKNNRNVFAHYTNKVYDKLAFDTVFEELYLLLLLSNILLVKSIIHYEGKQK